jgi:hypothetical protein
MGNSNSTRWNGHDRKKTVDDSLILSINVIHRNLVLGRSGVLTWQSGNRMIANLAFRVEGQGNKPVSIRVGYHFKGDPRSYRIQLTTTRLPWGGVRYWFECPNSECGKRVSTLYVPFDGNGYFYCRPCHDLTYTSSQTSHSMDHLFDSIAPVMHDKYPGITEEDLLRMLKKQSVARKKFLKSKKYARLLKKLSNLPQKGP